MLILLLSKFSWGHAFFDINYAFLKDTSNGERIKRCRERDLNPRTTKDWILSPAPLTILGNLCILDKFYYKILFFIAELLDVIHIYSPCENGFI